MMGERGRRLTQLKEILKENRGRRKLNEEAVD
jgi:hypothetical protein